MDRGDCQATVSRVAESDVTERLTLSFFYYSSLWPPVPSSGLALLQFLYKHLWFESSWLFPGGYYSRAPVHKHYPAPAPLLGPTPRVSNLVSLNNFHFRQVPRRCLMLLVQGSCFENYWPREPSERKQDWVGLWRISGNTDKGGMLSLYWLKFPFQERTHHTLL